VAIAIILYNVAVFFSAHFGVTNMRVLRYEGILRRRSSETLLGTLTDVKYSQSFLGRTLGFGDLQILTSSGAAGKDDFQTVSNASGLRTAIQEQKARSTQSRPEAPPVAQAPASPPAATAAPTSTAADEAANALARLDELHKQGLITDEEFAAKRTEILARI
jgi:uncharacterized membrane protein YdbT with pleckstrin-like domain